MRHAFVMLVVLLCSASGWGQKYVFDVYSHVVEKMYDIKVTRPDGFEELVEDSYPIQFYVGENGGFVYPVSLVSEDKNCLLLYPFFNYWPGIKGNAYSDLKASLGIDTWDITIPLDTARYVKIFTQGELVDCCNADTLTVYRMKLPKGFEYKEKYSAYVGILIWKSGYASGIMKMVLTEEGCKHADDYLKRFLGSMRYSDEAPALPSLKKIKKLRKRIDSRIRRLDQADKDKIRGSLDFIFPVGMFRDTFERHCPE